MSKTSFPKDFMWGAASSAHQVEGRNSNSWTAWEETPGRVRDNTRSGMAADFWHRYPEDFDLLKQLNLNAYRFSIEWSRVEPKEGQFDENALSQYAEMLDQLHKRGITPMVTLHHFTNPLWLEQRGGWVDSRTPEAFRRFAHRVAERLGTRVTWWCTLNEPTIELTLGYIIGSFPPGRHNYLDFWRARRNMVRAHKLAYLDIHTLYLNHKLMAPRIGIAHHLVYAEPRNSRNPIDCALAFVFRYLSNQYFISRTRSASDYIGVNYYFAKRIFWRFGGPGLIIGEEKLPNLNESDMGWEVYPEGLFHICRALAGERKPIYVTENGLADATDRLRGWSITQHLVAIERAIEYGANVRGYFHWSLTDTFEWENGFMPKFGLIEIDFETQQRTERKSALEYSAIAKLGDIPESLREKYS